MNIEIPKELIIKHTELREKLLEVNEKISEIQEIKNYKILQEKYLGKYFKYINNYSLPSDDSDYWNLYMKVISIEPDGKCLILSVEKDKDGCINIETKYSYAHGSNISCMNNEITKNEFMKSVKNITEEIDSFIF